MLLGEKIKHLRINEGLTQEMLARSSGILQSTISHVERGDYTTLGPKTLHKLASALNTTIEYLDGESGEVTSMERNKIQLREIVQSLKNAREKSRLKQSEVAELVGITISMYSKFETNRLNIMKDRYTEVRDKIVELFPEMKSAFNPESEVEEMKTNNIITDDSDKDQFTQEELKAMVQKEEVAADMNNSNKISGSRIFSEPAPNQNFSITNELQEIQRKNKLFTPREIVCTEKYELDDQTREEAYIASKNQSDQLKEFYKNSPKPNNDQFVNLYENPDNHINDTHNIQLPKGLVENAQEHKESFIDSLFNQKEQLSPERLHFNITADSNFQLLLFDYIHEKIMYYVRERKPITQYEYNLIVAEIDRYKGISSDAGNILEIKLSKLEILPEVEMKNDNPLSRFISNLVNASGCDIDGDILSIKLANGNIIKAFIDAQNETIKIIEEK